MATAPIIQKPSAPLLRRAAAALYVTTTYGIPCSPKTLAKLVGTGGGPAYRKAGAIPLYAKADLDRWASSKLGPLVRSSAELAEAA